MMRFNLKRVGRCFVSLAALCTIYACSDGKVEEEGPAPVQAVKLVAARVASEAKQHSFPAEVSAAKTVDISFEVSGRLIKENLLSGSRVAKGDLLAQIDPTPFKQRLREASTRLKQAERDLTRIEATYKKGLVSQANYDNAKTTHELAEIEYEKANQDLSYTALVAPFDATVAERLTENDSYVRAGDVVARIQDISRFFFNINVPERLFSSHRPGTAVSAVAHMAAAPDRRFPLEYVEHSTQPDPVTQTYKVVFVGGDVKDGSLTPGARAAVEVTIGQQQDDQHLLVPFSSLQGNDTQGFHLWAFNPETSQVNKASVKVLRVVADQALITGGIQQGDLVVAAGAGKMREGLVVKQYVAERN